MSLNQRSPRFENQSSKLFQRLGMHPMQRPRLWIDRDAGILQRHDAEGRLAPRWAEDDLRDRVRADESPPQNPYSNSPGWPLANS